MLRIYSMSDLARMGIDIRSINKGHKNHKAKKAKTRAYLDEKRRKMVKILLKEDK